EFIRRSRGEEEIKAFGLTVPLITKADGTKFGKTAGGAIWLDPEKTSPYEFYQFWYNTDDRDVVKFLNYFTFLEQEEIANLANEVENNPGARQAQKRLAEEMTKNVHSETALEQAIKIAEALLSVNVKVLTNAEVEQGFGDVQTCETKQTVVPLVDVLVEAKISS